ncbi:retrovirus-related pol polyprotein from transposon TNT 1-94 [Tanacetum coccineum]
MVTCWVLNSMITELSNAFLYTQSAKELWKEIAERYGQSNGQLIYQLERELSHISQGNLSIDSYFNKLKRCWDEFQNLNGLPTYTCEKMRECSCGILDKFLEMDSRSKLMHFLMKLSDEYKVVSTFFANLNGNKATNNGKKEFKSGGHNRTEFKKNEMFNQKLVAAVCLKVMNMFKGKRVADGGSANANQASSSMHYAGIFLCFTSAFALLCHLGMDVILDWISDTGASDHMSSHLHLFISVKTLKHPITVHLPNGRTKTVTFVGQVKFTPFLTLNNVFYVPDFQLNLLYVGRLIRDQGHNAYLYLNDFAFQVPSTNQIVVVGKGSKCLYI